MKLTLCQVFNSHIMYVVFNDFVFVGDVATKFLHAAGIISALYFLDHQKKQ